MINSLLVIPDAHSMPNVPQTRFTLLGKYIARKKPEVIVCLGDWADMGSLCSYEYRTRKAEGKRITDDIAAAVEAQELMFAEINKLNDRLRRNKKPLYKPELYMLLGNHEFRIQKATNEDPKTYGLYSIGSLMYQHFGWKVIPFLEPLELEGIAFSHYWPNAMNRPINSVTTIMNLPGGSKISGHSHVWDQRRDGRISPKVALIAGCFLDPRAQIDGDAMDYASKFTRQSWFNGLFLLHECENGSCLPVPITYRWLEETFKTKEVLPSDKTPRSKTTNIVFRTIRKYLNNKNKKKK